jgi:hypothetical protein
MDGVLNVLPAINDDPVVPQEKKVSTGVANEVDLFIAIVRGGAMRLLLWTFRNK